MRSPRKRRSDAKLIAGSTLLVLAVGTLVAGGIYVATRQDDATACGVVNAGDASELRRLAEDGPTSPFNVGAGCSYLLALDGDDLVALRPVLDVDGGHCSLQWRPSRRAFSCDGRTVGLDEVDRYETSIGTGELAGALLVDLRPAATTTTRPG